MERAFADYLSHAPVFIRRLSGEIVYWTQGAQELYGFTPEQAIGRSSHELLQTTFRRPLEEIDAELEREGCWEGVLGHTRADGTRIWTKSNWRLRRDDSGGPLFVVETNSDVSDRENLTRELYHRVSNVLTVVLGLAHLTFADQPEKMDKFAKRLSALASANEILLQHQSAGACMKEVILKALEPFESADRVDLDGEDFPLKPRSVLAYRLAFHELATNALKHGALSVPDGRVNIRWSLIGDHVHLIWREHGGPSLSEEPRRSPTIAGYPCQLLREATCRRPGSQKTRETAQSAWPRVIPSQNNGAPRSAAAFRARMASIRLAN